MVVDKAADGRRLVAEVVAELTGGEELPEGPLELLGEQMQRAATEFDDRTAEAFCGALLEHLSEDPGSLRELEALIILGLAHPKVLTRHRIPLAQEGRRLAVLLEQTGEVERATSLLEVLATRLPRDRGVDKDLASVMRRSGNVDLLVERYLRRAEGAVECGRPLEAIPWLQEVLVVDRSRRDVARMIRDLRWEEAQRIARTKRRLLFGTAALIGILVVTAIGTREWNLHRRYGSIPPASPGDRTSLQIRMEAVDALIADSPAWLGSLWASRERASLRGRIDRIAALEAERERRAIEERAQRLAEAENAWLRGREDASVRDFAGALEEFQLALEVAPPSWERRTRLETDVQALDAWLEDRPR